MRRPWEPIDDDDGSYDLQVRDIMTTDVRVAAPDDDLQHAASGMRVGGDTPQAFTTRIAQDYKVFGEVARRANVQTSQLGPGVWVA